MDKPTTETGVIRLDKLDEFIEHSAAVMKPALRSINILTPDMERPWLGSEKLLESLKLAIIKNRRLQVRLLVADPTLAIRSGHPLLGLIRKLSRFEARVISKEMQEKQPLAMSMVLVDRGGVVVRQSADAFIGFCHFDDKHCVKTLNAQFDQYWRFSETHADLRYFSI